MSWPVQDAPIVTICMEYAILRYWGSAYIYSKVDCLALAIYSLRRSYIVTMENTILMQTLARVQPIVRWTVLVTIQVTMEYMDTQTLGFNKLSEVGCPG